MSKRLTTYIVWPFAILLVFSISAGCNKKVHYANHLKNTTLKLSHPIKISIDLIEEHQGLHRFKPVFETQKPLTNVQLKWIVEVDQGDKYILYEQDFSREDFSIGKLREVSLQINDSSINHKVVLLVSGIIDGSEFNLSSIYNSSFQKEIDDAKRKLLERSSKSSTPDTL